MLIYFSFFSLLPKKGVGERICDPFILNHFIDNPSRAHVFSISITITLLGCHISGKPF